MFGYTFTGMKAFVMVWAGQFVSIMGTSISKFALIVWAYEKTGAASTTAMLGFASILPYVLLSPVAGVVVDRFDRKKVMIVADLMSGLVSVFIFILLTAGKLQVWHLFVTEALLGGFECFQVPAYTASITMMIPKEKYSKASGMRSFSSFSSQVLAPILGGLLIALISIEGILVVDFVTFLAGVSMLLIVSVPKPEVEQSHEEKRGIWNEFKFAVHYLLERRGLFVLMLVFVVVNFLATITYFGILPAMILARSGNDKMILAGVQAALGLGGIVGSLLLSVFGIKGKNTFVMMMSTASSYLLGDLFLGLGRTAFVWYVAAFLSSLMLPYIGGAQSALWQTKVEPNLQGRIFAIRGMMQTGSMPVGYLVGGLLADYVFEPAMNVGGKLTPFLSGIIPPGKGSGMALMFVMTGILGTIVCVGGYFLKDVRYLEEGTVNQNEAV